jgi:hypothetical protein
MGTEIVLTCDMVDGCTEPIAYIDHKGYIYCAKHGPERKGSGIRCRKLTPAELKQLQAGGTVSRY